MTAKLERIVADYQSLSPEEKQQVLDVLDLKPKPEVNWTERAALVRSFQGKYAHLPGSSEEFMRRKREDLELEEHRAER